MLFLYFLVKKFRLPFILHYLLGVINEEHAEEQSHESTVNSVHYGVAVDGEYDRNDPEEEQYPAASEKVHAPTWINNLSNDQNKLNFHMKHLTSDVNLGLEWEDGKTQTDEGCYSNRHEDPGCIVVDGDRTDHHAQGQGEDSEGNQITRRFPSHALATHKGAAIANHFMH